MISWIVIFAATGFSMVCMVDRSTHSYARGLTLQKKELVNSVMATTTYEGSVKITLLILRLANFYVNQKMRNLQNFKVQWKFWPGETAGCKNEKFEHKRYNQSRQAQSKSDSQYPFILQKPVSRAKYAYMHLWLEYASIDRTFFEKRSPLPSLVLTTR